MTLVTLENWQDPPFNRWAFQHIRELIPTARISRGHGAPRTLPRAERDLSGLPFRSGDRALTVGDMLAETYTDGFLVLHRGAIVAEQYGTGMRPDTTHLLMSVSKSVVSTVAGVLAVRGLLDTSATVGQVVPELAGTSFDGATVQHLLDMRAGTHFDEMRDSAQVERVYFGRPGAGAQGPPSALAYWPTLRNDGEHGGPFRYRSVLTDVLARVLEEAGGARLHELVGSLVWEPMGAEFDAEVIIDGHGNAMAHGGICATLRDLGRFGLLFAPGGHGTGDGPVVPAAWIRDTIAGAADGPAAFVAGGEGGRLPAGGHYRNCWWVADPAVPFMYALGINGQHVFVHPPSQTVVVKLSSWPTATGPEPMRMTTDAVRAITAALTRQSV